MPYDETTKRGAQLIRVQVIEQVMQQRGITQYKLAQKTGINKSILSKWWNGKQDLKLTDFIKILGALGIVLEFSVKENIDDPVDGFNYEHLN